MAAGNASLNFVLSLGAVPRAFIGDSSVTDDMICHIIKGLVLNSITVYSSTTAARTGRSANK